jgi:hypothetical protein
MQVILLWRLNIVMMGNWPQSDLKKKKIDDLQYVMYDLCDL